MPSRHSLTARLAEVTIRDERRLRRRLERLRGDEILADLEAEIEAAERRVARRRAAVPVPRYPAELPITARREDILAALRDNQVIVVAGETGSGKTTQLPKMCLELGLGVRGLIGHTQPRRIAARTVAERIAEELGTSVGQAVGYAVRFTDRVGEATLVKLMTDGILLAELHRDGILAAYDAIIVDEAHERSLNIDFLLGYLKDLLPRRSDLKLVITSATIDTPRFAHHFGDAPVIEVSGRSYPVEMRYLPIDDDVDQAQAIVDAVAKLSGEGPGDVLVFLSGERDIRDTAEALARALEGRPVEILPLYARLSAAEQHRVFAPHAGRRIVLATNVAETSLTVPGIRFVIDPGNARISRFNRRTKVQRLPIEPVSRASASQRAGRCGRVAPGICIRLYSEEDFAARPEFTDPEILRTNLASVILQMAALDLGDIAVFPFLDPPDRRAVRDGVVLLEEIGALDPQTGDGRVRLTPVGRQLARLPIDPRFGRMLVEAAKEGSLRELLVITAGLSIQDPRERPADRREPAAASHARFADPGSDFLSILSLWRYVQDRQAKLTSNQFRRLCRAEFLNFLRIREWQDLHSQLRWSAEKIGLQLNSAPAPPDSIHRAALAGLLSHVGMRDPQKAEYRGARESRFAIAPGSALARKGPRWIVAAELVETTRTWGRVAAQIDPAWAERLGAHLVSRSWGDPQWEAKRGAAVTDERVTLYGLALVPARRTDYSRVDAGIAREMFIRHALVQGDWQAAHAFVDHNARLIEATRQLEKRARRPLLVGDDALWEFYAARVGDQVTSGREFDRWWDRIYPRHPHLLDLTLEKLIQPGALVTGPGDFPDTWRQGDTDLLLSYAFDPGAPDDGVHVQIPLVLLDQLDESEFDWQVPGHRQELVVALIRSFPRQLRRRFVPATEFARAFLLETGPPGGPLRSCLEQHLGVPSGSSDIDSIPSYLRMTFRVVGVSGATIAAGKQLGALQRRLRDLTRAEIARAAGSIERTGQRTWTFGTIPRRVDATWAGYPIWAYPALVDEGSTVGLSACATDAEQRREMWAGTSRLLSLVTPLATRQLERWLPVEAKLALGRTEYGTLTDLIDDCATAAFDRALDLHGGPVWDEAAFAVLVSAARVDVAGVVEAVVSFAGGILTAAAQVQGRLDRLTATALQPAANDMSEQLAALVRPRFVQTTGAARLADVLRYVRAIDRRLDKLPEDPARDRQRMAPIQHLTEQYRAAVATSKASPSTREEIRWMLEELRVSTFAQVLGTPGPVSEQRVRRAIDRLDG
jgi:ATP-dependent helicase HrpA